MIKREARTMRNTAIVIPTAIPATALADMCEAKPGSRWTVTENTFAAKSRYVGIDAMPWVIVAEQSERLMEPRKIAFASRMNAVGSAAGGLYTEYGVGNKIGDSIPRLQ